MRVFLSCVLIVAFFSPAVADEHLLRSGDRIALVGGTVVERMQADGGFEAQLHCRQPDWKLSLRNLGWSGDTVTGIARKRFDTPADGYARLLADIDMAKPSVVVLMFGFAEAANGAGDLTTIQTDLQKLITDATKEDRRVMLVQPFTLAGVRSPNYADSMLQCRKSIARAGLNTNTPVIDLGWTPAGGELSEDRLQLSEIGHAMLADRMADAFLGDADCVRSSPNLRDAIVRKNELYFHRYRPQNETYLFLFRKHEQGNNAAEVEEFETLANEADGAIWQIAHQ